MRQQVLFYSFSAVIACLVNVPTVHSFVVVPAFQSRSVRSARSSSLLNPGISLSATKKDKKNNKDEDDFHYFDALALNTARTDVRNLLTQRAIQSFIFLLLSCRDPHTVRWLENTYEFKNMETYHGTGAFNLTKWSSWDSILTDMLEQPPDVVIVQARRRGRGHGGWSKKNPHLEERFVEFEIDIEPVSLVSRIVSVREQIAKEWVNDLDTLKAANDIILTSYHDNRVTDRDEEECLPANDDDNDDECIDIEDLKAPYSDGSDTKSKRRVVFDRTAMMMINNVVASSPLRKSNFDLLCLLVTQESVHRVLREYRQAGEERDVSLAWLREFYINHVKSHFDGHQEYGRADDFLEDLLLAPPSMRELEGSGKNNKIGLIDPLRIAEDIIEMRSEVAEDWKEIMARVPKDHMGLRKILLAKQMGNSVNPSPFAEMESSSQQTVEGEFE